MRQFTENTGLAQVFGGPTLGMNGTGSSLTPTQKEIN
jgi:hypothetical protein